MPKPQRLGEILPEVMQDIERRMESNNTETISPTNAGHQARVFGDVGAFMSGKRRKRTLCGVR